MFEFVSPAANWVATVGKKLNRKKNNTYVKLKEITHRIKRLTRLKKFIVERTLSRIMSC